MLLNIVNYNRGAFAFVACYILLEFLVSSLRLRIRRNAASACCGAGAKEPSMAVRTDGKCRLLRGRDAGGTVDAGDFLNRWDEGDMYGPVENGFS